MAKYLIEVPHDPDELACARAVQVFLSTGSHFLTQADWGCLDGVHSAWLVVDVADKDEALGIVPPAFRSAAHVVGLNQFSWSQIDPILSRHHAPTGRDGVHAG